MIKIMYLNYRQFVQYICWAQSKNRYNSGIVLRKVGILTLSANSGIVPDNSRIAQEMLKIDKVCVPAQSGNSWAK